LLKNIRNFSPKSKASLFPHKRFTKDLFFFYYEFVYTRVFSFEEPKSLMLIPLIDFLNHKSDETANYDIINLEYELSSNKTSSRCKLNKGVNLELLGAETLADSEHDLSTHLSL
jgi:hypothetical protein